MTGPLPAYSGATSCPKCTCEFIDSTYRNNLLHVLEQGDPIAIDAYQAIADNVRKGDRGPECMLRRCHDCGWAWLEHCADATGEA